MNYLEIKQELQTAIDNNDVDAALELINYTTARELYVYRERLKAREQYYNHIRENTAELADLTNEQMDLIFNSGLSDEQRKAELEKLGINFEITNQDQWQTFN